MARTPPDSGEQAEEVVVAAIKKFITREIEFEYNHRLVGVVHSRKSDVYDEAGIDVLAIFNTGLSLPLQVKLANKKLERHRKRHPFITHIFVVGGLPKSRIDQRQVYRRLYRQINKALINDRSAGESVK